MALVRVLLVDDEERFLETVSKLLRRRGYEPRTASGGAEALDLLEREDVDVVVLDVKMPGMDGLQVLKHVRARFPLVEVIMLTGHGTIDSAVEGLKNGAFDYLTKPCDIDELLAKCGEAFEKKNGIEEKIREAQLRKAMKSPKELVREIDKAREE